MRNSRSTFPGKLYTSPEQGLSKPIRATFGPTLLVASNSTLYQNNFNLDDRVTVIREKEGKY